MHQIFALLLQPSLLAERLHHPGRVHLPESQQGRQLDHRRVSPGHRPPDRRGRHHHGVGLPGVLRRHQGEPMPAHPVLRQPPPHLHPPPGSGNSGRRGREEGEGVGEGASAEVHAAVESARERQEGPGQAAGGAEVLRPGERHVRLGRGPRLVPMCPRRARMRRRRPVQHAVLRSDRRSAGETHGSGHRHRIHHRHPADRRDGFLDDPVLSDRKARRRHRSLNSETTRTPPASEHTFRLEELFGLDRVPDDFMVFVFY
ncbi:uncharacterized protein LOC133397382 isoform X1 [Phycodurus eques]|uniref:uncharacterized protein LOC133397382 isoform X1 n=1 Tax=Phycodurus eques TaxID=693459 RepID=UPI002ACEF7B2|nr:uncharacterized protein LOC133397382 isoform X1 [Phycodurus eques]